MSHRQPQKTFNFKKTLKKLSLSAFVVSSFLLYAAQKQFGGADATANAAAANPGTGQQDQQALLPTPAATDGSTAANTLAAAPTQPVQDTPSATPAPSSGAYKDGTYKGPEVDAFYGLVQVQATIQNGVIKNVQFLEYPTDRRTSARINSYAVPTLQQEAVQGQSANVNIITGATLTSEAFMMSLQSALSNAHG